MDINNIKNIQGAIQAYQKVGQKSDPKTGGSFGSALTDAIENVKSMQTEANQEISKLVVDQSADIHQTMIALEKADISFQLMMQTRNKIVQAYEEILRIQV